MSKIGLILQCILVSLSVTNSSNAQTCQWLKTKGSTFINGNVYSWQDRSNGVTADAFGNNYVTGFFKGSSITLGPNICSNFNLLGNADFFLAKYNSMGNIIWGRSGGGGTNDISYSVATDASGNVIITGSFDSPTMTIGTFTLINSGIGFKDVFVAKYDSSGTLQWAKRFGGASDDEGKSISTDAAGNVYVTGNFSSTSLTFAASTLSCIGYPEVFVVKYNSAGSEIWARNGVGNQPDYANGITTDGLGNIFVCGTFTGASISFGAISVPNFSSGNDIFIVKYNSNGNPVWVREAGDNSNDEANGISSDFSGNIYIIGSYSSNHIVFGTDTLWTAPPGSGSALGTFLAKYNNSGIVQWARGSDSACGQSNAAAFGVAVKAIGNNAIYVTGYFGVQLISFDSLVLVNVNGNQAQQEDIFILKYDASGNIQWGRSGGGASSDIATGISANNIGEFVTGYIRSSSISFDTITANNTGNILTEDIFLYKCHYLAVSNYSNGECCSTINNGNVSVSAYGDYPPLTYLWNVGQSGQSLSNLGQGIYTVTITDAQGCVITFSVVVNTVSNPGLQLSHTNVLCHGGNSGTAIVTPTGFGPFSYLWNTTPPQTTASISGLYAGTYIITLTGYNSCTTTQSVTITEPTAISLSAIHSDAGCVLAHNGNATVTVSGGIPPYIYAWNNGENSATDTALGIGNYSVIVTDSNNCTNTTSVTINSGIGANFSYVVNNMTVHFTMNDFPNCSSSGWLWDYGNGMFSSIASSPFVTYNNPGSYTACLQCDNLPSVCIVCATITLPGNYSGNTSVLNSDLLTKNLFIFPNPAATQLTINFNSTGEKEITITDITGKVINTFTTANNAATIPISNLNAGMYLAVVKTKSGERATAKFIKE